jgi:hypothetical protein
MLLVMIVSLPVDIVLVPNSQQEEPGFIPGIGPCAATICLSYGWYGAVAINKLRRVMTVVECGE